MELNWLESIVLGLISGLADVLPVSAQAHKTILLKIFGVDREPGLLRMMIHLGTLAALYYCSSNQIMRIIRQKRLARIPKKKRRRPVDVRTLLEFRLLCIMIVPVIISLFFYNKTAAWGTRLNLTALFLLINGIILFIPGLLPTGNKDSRSMSALEGVLVGLGGAAEVLPGVSALGTANAVASVCGAERSFALNLTYLMHMVLTAGMIILDVIAISNAGLSGFTFAAFLYSLAAAAAAFCASFFGIRLMRAMAQNVGFGIFAYYCFGAALFSFVLYLMV